MREGQEDLRKISLLLPIETDQEANINYMSLKALSDCSNLGTKLLYEA